MTGAYPIAEVFESVQGEGVWAGTPMTFIRLAGCNVGKPFSKEARQQLHLEEQPYRERCTLWDGVGAFPCDTNYQKSTSKTVEAIVNLPEVQRAQRVCITGGEPFLHDMHKLVGAFQGKKKVHIETSGTLPVKSVLPYAPWITCSPKEGFLIDVISVCNEIKLLVGPTFDEEKFLYEFRPLIHTGKIFFQPIEQPGADNVPRTLALVQKYRGCRLSLQLHKIIGVA